MKRLKTWLLITAAILLTAVPSLASTTSNFWWWQPGMKYSKMIVNPDLAKVQAVLDLAGPGADQKLYIQQSPGNLDADSTIWVHGNTAWVGAGKGISTITRTRFNAADPANTGHVLISAPYGSHAPNNVTVNPGTGIVPRDSLENIHLQGFTIDGNNTFFGDVNPNTPGNFGIQLWFVDGAVLRDLEVRNTLQTGLELDACRNSSMSGISTRLTGQQTMLGSRNGININNNSGSSNVSLLWGRGITMDDIQVINQRGAAIDFSSVSEVTVDGVYMHCDFDSVSNIGPPNQDVKYGFEVEGNSPTGTMRNISISNVVGVGLTGRFLTKGGSSPPIEGLRINNVTWTAGDSSFQGAIALGSSPGGAKDVTITNATFLNLNGKNVPGDCAPYCSAAGIVLFADDSPTDSIADVVVENVTVHFKNGNVRHQPNAGVIVGGKASNITLKDVRVYNSEDQGFRVIADDGFTSRNITLQNCSVDGAMREGFAVNQSGVTGDLNGVKLLNCQAKDTNKDVAGYSFLVQAVTGTDVVRNLRIEGCSTVKTSGTNMLGLRLNQTGSGVIDSVIVNGNDFSSVVTPYEETGTITNVILEGRAGYRPIDGRYYKMTGAGLNFAIGDCASTGCDIELAPGTFSIANQVNVNKDRITIRGQGVGTVLSNDANGIDIFQVENDNIRLQDMKLVGNKAVRASGRGVDIRPNADSTIVERLTISDTGDAGIGAGNPSSRVIVRECQIMAPGSTASSDGFGIIFSDVDNGRIENNTIDGSKVSSIYVHNGSDRTQISGNRVTNSLDNGIRFLASTGILVDRNTVTGSVVDGFRCNGDSAVVSNNVSLSNTGVGFKADGVNGSLWTGNLASYNTVHGISISSTAATASAGVSIIGNRCFSNNVGIQVYANAVAFSDIKVMGNQVDVTNNGFGGIRILAASGGTLDRCTVTGNTIRSAAGDGIEVKPNEVGTGTITSLVVSGNEIFNSASDGIQVLAATNACTAYIGNNIFQGNGAATENLSGTNWTYHSAQKLVTLPFAELAGSDNGSMVYCSDCTKATPCAGAGAGALATRINGAWDCNP